MSNFVVLESRSYRKNTYLGEHLGSSESLDVSNRTRSSLLELDVLESLVEVQCVVTAARLHLRLFSHVFYHLN